MLEEFQDSDDISVGILNGEHQRRNGFSGFTEADAVRKPRVSLVLLHLGVPQMLQKDSFFVDGHVGCHVGAFDGFEVRQLLLCREVDVVFEGVRRCDARVTVVQRVFVVVEEVQVGRVGADGVGYAVAQFQKHLDFAVVIGNVFRQLLQHDAFVRVDAELPPRQTEPFLLALGRAEKTVLVDVGRAWLGRGSLVRLSLALADLVELVRGIFRSALGKVSLKKS